MVCLECYLPPILFMLYLRFVQPIISPFIQPLYEKVVTYFWGPQALQGGACPIRPSSSKAKKSEPTGDTTTQSQTATTTTTTDASKAKEE